MAKKKISIKDIARELGISITTVSFILNGKAKEKRISDEMTKKVQNYIKEVGYTPSYLAQSLRLGKSKVIVFMIEDISNQFFASIARMIEERAYKNGYKIIYCSTENDTEKAKELINTFKIRNVDGFIITPTPGLEPTIQELLEEDLALVLFDRWVPSINCSYVIVENEKSAFEATLHLIQNGCKKIAFLTVDSDQMQMKDRLQGYQKAVAENNLSSSVFKIKFHNIDEKEAYLKIIEFFRNNQGFDGVFFATNYLAFEGLQALDNLGIKVPEEVKVVSFDDHYFFNLYKPKISAIEQPLEIIAEKLMEAILHHLDSNESKHSFKKFILPNKLNIRESSSN
ncbi:transcriptional regulator, LacI family [Aquiflexum balticum DSM 16537]|uniref:Transcriptional regulator, LacI family n=1 Tax=Aquiflexum balticum DSM 16537 TaxID=758820 RepID=A0A1W2H4Y9_9BACT|nr:LacI family DNA-binding transcriptional regulator [Aquiflexum balticum]SMD44027.1 transcriptional regulator, LacI family [Aquiflexum balticum DSM 16537]